MNLFDKSLNGPHLSGSAGVRLKPGLMSENPRVGGSIPPLATIKSQ
jgi:hypothetical protein